MSEDERRAQLPRHSNTALHSPRPLTEELREIDAIHILHHQIVEPQLLTKVMNGHDVRMIQTREDLRLTLKSCRKAGLDTDLLRQHFHRHKPVEPFLPRLVNRAHATLADHPQPFVIRQ